MSQSPEETVQEVKTALQERISERSEAIKVPKISLQRSVEVVKTTSQERISARRTVEQYLDVSAEVDKNVLQERISEGTRDQISRKHLQCCLKWWELGCTLSCSCARRVEVGKDACGSVVKLF